MVGFLSLVWGLIAAMIVFGGTNIPPGVTWKPASLVRAADIATALWLCTSTMTKVKLALTGCYSGLGKVLGVTSCFSLAFMVGATAIMERTGPPSVFHPVGNIFVAIWFLGWFLIDVGSILSD